MPPLTSKRCTTSDWQSVDSDKPSNPRTKLCASRDFTDAMKNLGPPTEASYSSSTLQQG